MSLYSNWSVSKPNSLQKKIGLTGTVLDSGHGVTHVIPIYSGSVVGSCIRHIPLAGKEITNFIKKFL
jgi:actin-related protein 3